MFLRAQGALRVGRIVGTGDLDVTFAAGDDPGAGRVDLALAVGLQDVPERTARHHRGRLHAAGFEEGRGEVGQRDHVVYHASALYAGAGYDERDARAEAVEVALAVREARGAVVAAHCDQRLAAFAGAVEFFEQHAHRGVEGLDFAEVVGEVFAHHRDVRQEGRQLALEGVGIEAPEFLATAPHPGAVGIGRAEPIGEGLTGGLGREHRLEITADLFEELGPGRLDRGALRHEVGRVLREVIEGAS